MSHVAMFLLGALVASVAWLFVVAWMQDRLEAARLEHDRIVRLLDESREFGRECMAQSKRMAHHAIENAPRTKGV